MHTVLVIGGSGLIGKHLCKKLQENGFEVSILSRTLTTKTNHPIYTYNIDQNYINLEAICKADFIINISGAGIADKRWSSKRKQTILDSRVENTEFIFKKVQEYNKNLQAYVSASAIGYYGAISSEKIFEEDDPAASDFIGNVCSLWEQSVDQFTDLGIRTVKIRIGIVLARDGGALSKMLTPIKMGLGSALGKGSQYMPWIHIDDLCNIFLKAIKDKQMHGAYNAVAPEHQTNKEFSKTISKVLNKPFFFPNIPSFIMKLFFGEMAQILLKGSRVSAKKIINSGFKFKFGKLKEALQNLLK